MQTTVDHKKLYEEQVKITRYQAKKIDELSFKLQELAHQLFQFKKLTFGSKHERFIPSDPQQETSQIALDLEVETVGECKITDVKEIKYLRTKTEVTKNIKPHPGRNALPSNLRRETIFLTPDMDTSNLKKIGEEITEVLDLIPGEFYVKQFIRAKYVVP